MVLRPFFCATVWIGAKTEIVDRRSAIIPRKLEDSRLVLLIFIYHCNILYSYITEMFSLVAEVKVEIEIVKFEGRFKALKKLTREGLERRGESASLRAVQCH